MLYSEFVKEQMMKLKGSDMSAPQKMKHIAEQWKKSKGSQSEKEIPMKETPKKSMPKKSFANKAQGRAPERRLGNARKPQVLATHSDEILNMLGVDMKKSKQKPKSERAVKKVVKAMEKMIIPVEEKAAEMPKHPIHLMEKEETKQKRMFDDDDDIGF